MTLGIRSCFTVNNYVSPYSKIGQDFDEMEIFKNPAKENIKTAKLENFRNHKILY